MDPAGAPDGGSMSSGPSGRDVLVVVAHGDDEVLGAGGTLFQHAVQGDRVHLVVLSSGDSSRHLRSNGVVRDRRPAIQNSALVLGLTSVEVLDYPDSRFDSLPLLDFVHSVEAALERTAATVVYTHSPHDLHNDHRVAAVSTATACRPFRTNIRLVAAFEVRSSSDWAEASGVTLSFSPNYWSVLGASALDAKMRALRCYHDELRPWPHSRSERGVTAMLMHRGAQVHHEAAEAFQILRAVGLNSPQI